LGLEHGAKNQAGNNNETIKEAGSRQLSRDNIIVSNHGRLPRNYEYQGCEDLSVFLI
jgi:hypothetical protein